MSISPVTSNAAYAAPTPPPADPVTSTPETTTSDDDYSSYWNQFDKDCCNDAMNNVNQAQAEEKKQEQEVCPKFG